MNNDDIKKFALSKDTIIVFDTNAFLFFYETSHEIDASLYILKDITSKIYMPYVVSLELKRNELVKKSYGQELTNLRINLDNLLKKTNQDLLNQVATLSKFGINFGVESKKLIKQVGLFQKYVLSEFSKLKNKHDLYLIDDLYKPINDLISDVQKNRLFPILSLEEYFRIGNEGIEKKEAHKFFLGKKDKGKKAFSMDDYVIWNEIILYAKSNSKNVLYITNDDKEWPNGAFPDELKEEFNCSSKMNVESFGMSTLLEAFGYEEVPKNKIYNFARKILSDNKNKAGELIQKYIMDNYINNREKEDFIGVSDNYYPYRFDMDLIDVKEVEESEDTLDVMYSGIYNLYFRAEGEFMYYIYEIAIWYNFRFLIDDLKNNIFNPSITYDETIEMNVEEEEYNLCPGCGVIMTEDNSNPGDDYCGDCNQGIDKVMNS